MSYTARRQALSLETRTHTHPHFSSVSFSFDTAGGRCDLSHTHGGGGENKHPGMLKTPPQSHKKAPRIDQQGKGKVFIPQTVPKLLQRQTRPIQGLDEDRGRDGTHQPHRIRLTPALAATTHHPSPATRPNRMPTLRSHHHLGHTPATNQPRSRPHHTRQPGRTQHPRQRANHLQNMQQKQRQSQRTKHSIPTTNHKNIDSMVKNPPTPTGDTPLHTRARGCPRWGSASVLGT